LEILKKVSKKLQNKLSKKLQNVENSCVCVDVVPIPVAVQSKVWVCGHLFAGIVGES
jgi:hypothetical protein